MFLRYLWENPELYFSWIVIVIFSICVHEFCHAWTAMKLGDDAAARMGYLSLNPMQVMGGYSLAALVLIGIAWGSVPVRREHLRFPAAAPAVSVSGPASNLALLVAFSFFAAVAGALSGLNNELAKAFGFLFRVGALANAFLFLLNILPVPVLDGWEVATFFVPRLQRLDEQTRGYITLGALLLLLFGGGFTWLWRGAALLSSLAGAIFAFIPQS